LEKDFIVQSRTLLFSQGLYCLVKDFIVSVKCMTRIIAIFNQAGGVGKSTLTMNLGYHLAQLNRKVLIVDMDPQGSLTTFMGLEASELESTVYNAVVDGGALPISQNIHGMDLVPSNIDLSGAELVLVMVDLRDFRLKQALEPIENKYDFILIDCPPSLGILSYISLVAATHVLIPIQTHNKALRGTELLFQTLGRVQRGANRHLKIAGIIPTLYDGRTAQGNRSLDSIRQLGSQIPVYETIPVAIAFADASEKHLPLALYNPNHPTVKVLEKTAKRLDALQ
jgi:chromosome partitioning protein